VFINFWSIKLKPILKTIQAFVDDFLKFAEQLMPLIAQIKFIIEKLHLKTLVKVRSARTAAF
jgi:hypothetical protein